MPEGDTIRRLADLLSDRFVGQEVVSNVFRHPRLVRADFTGATLTNVDARGKHLLIRFSNDYSIHVHLRMNGSVYPRLAAEVQAHRRRFEIQLTDGWVSAVDIPVLQILRTRDEGRVVGHLGPDLCGNYCHEIARRRLSEAGETPISEALLDQRIVAGFGNIYSVETPFIVGINPQTPVSSLDNVDGLLSLAVGLIRTNARRGPQNTTGRKIHLTDHWVLSGNLRICKVCGTELKKLSSKATPWGRRTSWCPECQLSENTEVNLVRAAKLLARHPCRAMVDVGLGKLIQAVDQPVRSEFLRSNEGGLKRIR